MHLISTAKSTILTDFNNLKTLSTSPHVNGQSTDFQCYNQQAVFVEVIKNSGLEIMRLKEKNEGVGIQRVRKLNIGNVFCVGCAKQSMEEMALGLSNGQVKVYNYKTSKFVQTFNADSIRNGVSFLDYNASDDYIASVTDGGHINLYGVKSSAKIESINIDGNSSLARFHPTKRFHLSVASYKGAVSIYDVTSKKKLLHSTTCHKAPCRDLCMAPDAPDTLVSVGYDCFINIFDTRRKTQPLRIQYPYPLSTVAIAPCGSYFVVGTLKGELVSFDMRNTKSYLKAKKVHEATVSRVAFVDMPSQVGHSLDGSSESATASSDALGAPLGRLTSDTEDLHKSKIESKKQRDSFCDFLDYQTHKGLDRMSTRLGSNHRDSFDWETLNRKPELMMSGIASRGGGDNALTALSSANNKKKESHLNLKCKTPKLKSAQSPQLKCVQSPQIAKPQSLSPSTPLREVFAQDSGSVKLQQIKEEPAVQQQKLGESFEDHSDKENVNIRGGGVLPAFPPSSYSTPTDPPATKPLFTMNDTVPNTDSMMESALIEQQEEPHAEETECSLPGTVGGTSPDICAALQAIRSEFMDRLKILEDEIKLNIESNKWQIFMQASKLRNDQMDALETVKEALAFLLQTDPFVNEFTRLKEENRKLKAELEQKQQQPPKEHGK